MATSGLEEWADFCNLEGRHLCDGEAGTLVLLAGWSRKAPEEEGSQVFLWISSA